MLCCAAVAQSGRLGPVKHGEFMLKRLILPCVGRMCAASSCRQHRKQDVRIVCSSSCTRSINIISTANTPFQMHNEKYALRALFTHRDVRTLRVFRRLICKLDLNKNATRHEGALEVKERLKQICLLVLYHVITRILKPSAVDAAGLLFTTMIQSKCNECNFGPVVSRLG